MAAAFNRSVEAERRRRKRKKYENAQKQRPTSTKMKAGWGVTCKRKAKCSDLFSDVERKSFNTDYHKRDYS